MRRVIVAGSRTFDDYEQLSRVLDRDREQRGDFVLISGGARGADLLGERYAREHGLEVEVFAAQWDKYGKRAGFLRNEEMAKAADQLIAFWDRNSNGTRNMIATAKAHGLGVLIVAV